MSAGGGSCSDDTSAPNHRESIPSQRIFNADAERSKSSLARDAGPVLFYDDDDYDDDDTTSSYPREPCASPFASDSQGGLSYPAWPTATCNTTEEDDFTWSTPMNDFRPREEPLSGRFNAKLPHPRAAVPLENEAALTAQRKQQQHKQQQQQNQGQQEEEESEEQEQQQQRQRTRRRHRNQQQQQQQQQQQHQQDKDQEQQQKQKQKKQKQKQQQQQQQRCTKGDGRGEYCQAKNCPEPPSYSEDGHKPAMWCRDHREDDMFRVQHGNKTCIVDGCTRKSEVNYMDQDSEIYRFCAQHKEPAVVLGQAACCEFGSCDGTPRYGTRDGPLSYCQAHKRSGMYTVLDGVLYIATRDGSAFRRSREEDATAVGHAAAADGAATAIPPASWFEPIVKAGYPAREPTKPPASSSPPRPVKIKNVPSRKVCQVSGCKLHPSYGEAGSRKPRFCFSHKEKNHISLKNRPCVFPGCVTRPHYGPSRGRPVFCVTHKKKNHVHLLKEAESLDKEELQRKRGRKSPTAATGKKDRLSSSKGSDTEKSKKQAKEKSPSGASAKDGAEKKQAKEKSPSVASAKDGAEKKQAKGKSPSGASAKDGAEKKQAKEKSPSGASAKDGAEKKQAKGISPSVASAKDGAEKKQAKEKSPSGALAKDGAEKKQAKGKSPSGASAKDGAEKKDAKPQGTGKEERAKENGKGKGKGKGAAREEDSPRDAARAVGKAAAVAGKKSATPAKKKGKDVAGGVLRVQVTPSLLSPASASADTAGNIDDGLGLSLARTAEAPPGIVIPGDEGREAPHMEGEGGGSGGRRARAPSRKLLEASGKVADEGVQLLTKEKRLEETRRKMAIKEQRRAAKTAGLRLGQVIEATSVPLSFNGGEAGSGSGGGSRDSDKSGAFSVGEAAPLNLSWRKLSPAELVQAAKLQQQQQQQQQEPAIVPTKAEAKSGAVTGGEPGGAGAISPTATAESGNNSPRKRKGAASSPAPSPQHSLNIADAGSGKASRKRGRFAKVAAAEGGNKDEGGQGKVEAVKRRSSRGHGEGERIGKVGSETARGRVVCEHDNCSAPASYGVGDIVRYCKKHKTATGK